MTDIHAKIKLLKTGDKIRFITLSKLDSFHQLVAKFILLKKNIAMFKILKTKKIFKLDLSKTDLDNNIINIEVYKKKPIQLNLIETIGLDSKQDLNEMDIEIKQRELSIWERNWTEREFIDSISENLSLNKSSSVKDFDNIVKKANFLYHFMIEKDLVILILKAIYLRFQYFLNKMTI